VEILGQIILKKELFLCITDVRKVIILIAVHVFHVGVDGIKPELTIQLHVITAPMDKRLLGRVQFGQPNALTALQLNTLMLRQIGRVLALLQMGMFQPRLLLVIPTITAMRDTLEAQVAPPLVMHALQEQLLIILPHVIHVRMEDILQERLIDYAQLAPLAQEPVL